MGPTNTSRFTAFVILCAVLTGIGFSPYAKGEGLRVPGASRLPPISGGNTPNRKLTADSPDPDDAGLDSASWWSPRLQTYHIGFEATGNAVSVLGAKAMAFGLWMENLGLEFYLGYNKDADTYAQTVNTTDTVTSNARTIETSHAGIKNPHTFIVGVAPKIRIYQTNWVQIHVGGMLLVQPPSSISYPNVNSTRTETIANLADPTTYTVSETNAGTTTSKTGIRLAAGPRVGAEFYLKWFPHLALGFSTGILVTVGGSNTTTTPKRTRTFVVTNGVEQAPQTDSTVTTVVESKRPIEAATFGIGGTQFSITQAFTIRYVW